MFLRYPEDPVQMVANAPASSELSALCANDGQVPIAVGRNVFWQELNRRLGAPLGVQSLAGGDYWTKLNVTLAGNDLPDVTQLRLQIPRLSGLLPERFMDLSDFLAGSAVLDYPGLANLPTGAWRSVAISGGVYGVPYPRALPDSALFLRVDLAERVGTTVAPRSAAEFTEMCDALTDGSRQQFALGSGLGILNWALAMFGAPNQWRIEPDGRFVRTWETAEYRAAVEFVRDLHVAGFFHPNAFSATATTAEDFTHGRIAMMTTNVMWWPNFYRDAAGIEGFDVAPILPAVHDGSGPAGYFLGDGLFTFAAIRSGTSPERVREILRVQNYLAAPFGTAEHLFRTYGESPRHHLRESGDPVLTDRGATEVSTLPVRYLSGMPPAIHFPGRPEIAKRCYEVQKEMIEGGIPLPTAGLVADAQTEKGTTLDRSMLDVVADVIQQRRGIEDFDRQVKSWRSSGGQEIAEEYQAAHEAQ